VYKRQERHGLAEQRQRLLAPTSGRVIEVGAGNGLNFAHYPAAVREVVAVEPEDHLRDLAREAAALAPVPIDVVDGVAEELPFADRSFDAVVASLVLCSVLDPQQAVAEMWRVLRPGGLLVFLEHVAGSSSTRRRVQHGLDAVLWPHVAGGCRLSRDTVGTLVGAGFVVEAQHRLGSGSLGFLDPTAPHLSGVARRPA
jgi:ubiquinone/menaquinone biosynthesis C-methylase UbiE